MNCQSLFLGKVRKHVSKCRLLKFLPSMLRLEFSADCLKKTVFMMGNENKTVF